MAKRITGIDEIERRIDSALNHRRFRLKLENRSIGSGNEHIYLMPNVSEPQKGILPRPKIILVDHAWDLNHEVMPTNFAFTSEECREINRLRTSPPQNPASTYEQIYSERHELRFSNGKSWFEETTYDLHGTTCAAIIQLAEAKLQEALYRKEPKSKSEDAERHLWNLAKHADLLLTPVRDCGFLDVDRLKYRIELRTLSQIERYSSPSHQAYWRAKGAGSLDLAEDWCEAVNLNVPRTKSRMILNVVVSQHLRAKHSEIDKELLEIILEELWFASSELYAESGIVAALSKLESLASLPEPAIGAGDVIVLPLEYKPHYSTENYLQNSRNVFGNLPENFSTEIIGLPIIVYPEVERLIERLTCKFGISVIIPSGNRKVDLGILDLNLAFGGSFDDFFPMLPDDTRQTRADIFQNRGVECGAVIVGSIEPSTDHYWANPLKKTTRLAIDCDQARKSRDEFRKANWGACVDVFGRGGPTSVTGDPTGNALLATPSKEGFEFKTSIPKECYAHWHGSSVAAMVTAACLSNLQLYRSFLRGLQIENKLPAEDSIHILRPFEARAHLREWRSLDINQYLCNFEMMGPPPDLIAMLKGTKVGELEDWL